MSLIEEIDEMLADEKAISLVDEDFLREVKTELQKREWVKSIDSAPEFNGEYLCKVFDARDDSDEVWYEVVEYSPTKRKAFGKGWNLADFDEVIEWKEI